MNRKEKIDLLLSKVQEDKKEAFITDLRGVTDKDSCIELLKKYDITISEDEKAAITSLSSSNEVSDEELDSAAGGCVTFCQRECNCKQNCYN